MVCLDTRSKVRTVSTWLPSRCQMALTAKPSRPEAASPSPPRPAAQGGARQARAATAPHIAFHSCRRPAFPWMGGRDQGPPLLALLPAGHDARRERRCTGGSRRKWKAVSDSLRTNIDVRAGNQSAGPRDLPEHGGRCGRSHTDSSVAALPVTYAMSPLSSARIARCPRRSRWPFSPSLA